jgi:hypothetical protein
MLSGEELPGYLSYPLRELLVWIRLGPSRKDYLHVTPTSGIKKK